MNSKLSGANVFQSLRRYRSRSGNPLSRLVRLALCVSLGTATVIGCGWYGGESSSVRFGYQTARELARLPPLPGWLHSTTPTEADRLYQEDGGEDNWRAGERRAPETNELWQQAETAEQQGNLAQAHALLRAYLARTAIARDSSAPQNRQARRNSAIDRLDALAALEHGAPPAAAQAYLMARRLYDEERAPEEVWLALADVPPHARLRDNVAYLRAALLYRAEQYQQAEAAFEALAVRFPHSEKREAALFMAGVVALKQSRAYTGTSGDPAHLAAGNRDNNRERASAMSAEDDQAAVRVAAREDGRDAAWHRARYAFMRGLRQFPRGRYAADARGWLAYLHLRAGDRAAALVEYYRLLSDEYDPNARVEAVFSLTLVRHHATDEEMRRVEAELAAEPAAALAYAYHNLYNYAIDPGCPLVYYESCSGYEFQAAARRVTMRAEKERIVAFATRMMRRYPRAAVGGSFALRVAQANLELGEERAALEQARRALALHLQGDERARALWVKGVAEHRLRAFAAARQTFHTLLAEYPQGELVEGARRFLALITEDAGDLEGALEQYIALGYQSDVGYFVDVLLTPEQLAAFAARQPDTPLRDELYYALGVRYLRGGSYHSARAAFAQVRTTQPDEAVSYAYDDYNNCGRRRCSPKNPHFSYSHLPGVRTRWVLRDLQTAHDLERLERAVAEAEGEEAKAEALYQLASYIYESSTLLFYNPAAWRGARYRDIATLHDQNSYRAPNEAQLLWRYMQEHDTLARALALYLEVARRFPNTRAARDALYTAAVGHELLANFNPYWRSVYEIGLHAGARMVTYEDVRRAYPGYQLPRGTNGWEPSTRTVNGGPGWAAAPPRVRLTRWQRNEIRVRRVAGFALHGWHWVAGIWETQVKRWLMIWLAATGAVCALLFAGRTRVLWREQRARFPAEARTQGGREERAGAGEPFLSSTKPFGQEVRDELRARCERAARLTLRLLLDQSGRRALVFNLLAHTMLAAMLLTLLRAWRGG